MNSKQKKRIEKIIDVISISEEIQKESHETSKIIEIVNKALSKIKLTEKQLTVLELTGKGLNITQIACKMGVTYQCIQKHKESIVSKVIKHLEEEVFF